MKEKDFSSYAVKIGTLEVLGELVGPGMTKIITDSEAAQHIAATVSADYNKLIDDILSDSIVSVAEKPALKSRWDEITLEYPIVKANAVASGISISSTTYTAYEAAYQALDLYLNTTIELFSDMSTATSINAAAFAMAFNNYYATRFPMGGYAALLQMLDRSTITPQEKNTEARRWIAIAGDGSTTGAYWTTRNQALNIGVPTDEMDYDYYNLYEYLFVSPGILNVATWDETITIIYATYEGYWAQLNTSISSTNYTISKFTSSTLYENLDCGDYSAATSAESNAFMTDLGEYLEAYELFDMADYDGLDFALYDSGDYEAGVADTQPNWDCGVHSVGSLILLFPGAEVDCGEF